MVSVLTTRCRSVSDRLLEEQEVTKKNNQEAERLRSECHVWRIGMSVQVTWHG